MFQAKDGLKFSFGFRSRQQNSSAFSTPTFPSIQISRDSNPNPFHSRHKPKAVTQRVQMKKSPSEIYRELGGGGVELIPREKKLKLRLNDKFVQIISGDASSIEKNEVKSVKSAHLANENILQTEKKKKERRIYKNKNFHSLANILQLKAQPQHVKISARTGKSKQNIPTQLQTQNKARLIRSNIKDLQPKIERKDTKKVVNNNFFQVSPKNIEMRQTKKQNRSLQKQYPVQKQKSKIFKAYFQKARPTLRIAGRLLNNERLQTIVKDYDTEFNSKH